MRLIITLFVLVTFFSCSNYKKTPDVSNIKIEISTGRFERDLFGMDTSNFSDKLTLLLTRYPSFGEFFLSRILSVDPAWSTDSINHYVASFIASYKPVYDSAQKLFSDFSSYENEIKQSLQYLQYYFPKYKIPHHIITYIGPIDGYGDIILEDALAVGLQVHLGKNYPAYKSTWLRETYPEYLTNRFEPSYIAVNCMNNIIGDMFGEKNEDKTLIVQMVDKGKKLYMLSRLLPGKEEYKLIGYTEKQLKECYKQEARIWDLFIQNSFLQTIDKNVIKNYIDEGPKTQELGEGSPGKVAVFTGWQIVKKYMEKNPEISLPQLMETDPEIIFEQTKYKP